MSRFSTNVLLILLLFNANVYGTVKSKKIKVSYHKTVETIMILRAISDEDYFFNTVPASRKSRPLIYEARKHFATHKDHPAVKATQRILEETKDIGGILFQGIMFAEELPGTKILYAPEGYFWDSHAGLLRPYLDTLADFYKDGDVAAFLEKHKAFYNGACAEVNEYMNNSLISGMEQYFGIEHASYTVYIMPISPYGWCFSISNGKKEEAQAQYALISPVKKLKDYEDIHQLKEYGYKDSTAHDYYRETVNHEFCHSFITNTLLKKEILTQINSYDTLFTPLLDSLMQEQAYGNWWDFVNELVVRLGEVRVAAQMHDTGIATLRKNYVNECSFALIPDLELVMKQYEENRGKYKNIDSFIPVLIGHLGTFTKADIDKKISISLQQNE